MTISPAPEPTAQPARLTGQQVLELQVDMLGELAQAGLKVALSIQRQVEASEADPHWAPTIAAAGFTGFTRVARAVRLTLMLQARVVRRLDGLETAAEQARDGLTAERKALIGAVVGRVAADQRADAGEVERLVRETAERLDQEDFADDLLARPVGELVATICEALGLEPDWPRLAQEAWAREASPPLGVSDVPPSPPRPYPDG